MKILSDFFQLIALDMSGKEISFENIAKELTKEGIVKEWQQLSTLQNYTARELLLFEIMQ